MRIYNFVKPELDYFREMCNFSEEEMTFFNYRAQHYSHHEIAVKMICSQGKVARLATSVKTKIRKVQKPGSEKLD